MLLKAKPPKPTKPEPIYGQAGNKVVQPVRCTAGGEVMVCQVNQLDMVGDGVNRKNKDGVLALGDDGRYLRNIKVDPEGHVIVKYDRPIDVVPHLTEIHGHVTVEDTVTVEPVTVANMPKEMKIQENLHIVQTPLKARVTPISFEGCGDVVIPRPCKVYSIHLTVYEPTFIEVVGVTGEMWTREFKMNLFPQFVQVNELEIKTREHVYIGGYVIYENC